MTLNCTAQYEKQHCENISVFWCLSVEDKPCEPLTDLDKYLIHISETKLSKETLLRQQDACVTFTQLTRKDTGFYQCKAKCQHTGATAMGHRINVTVTGISFVKITKNCFFSYSILKTFRISASKHHVLNFKELYIRKHVIYCTCSFANGGRELKHFNQDKVNE